MVGSFDIKPGGARGAEVRPELDCIPAGMFGLVRLLFFFLCRLALLSASSSALFSGLLPGTSINDPAIEEHEEISVLVDLSHMHHHNVTMSCFHILSPHLMLS